MRFVINSKELAERIANVSRVQASKNALPILDCILLRVEEEKLTLVASDSEMTMSATAPVTEAQDGAVALLAKQFLSAIKEISDRPIVISVNDETYATTVDYGNGMYQFVGQDANEFPVPQPINGEVTNIESNIIQTGINAVFGAIAEDELRPQMNGIYLDDTPQGFVMVAADKHKLSKFRKYADAKCGLGSFILPAKAAKILRGMVKDEQDVLSFMRDEQRFSIAAGNYALIGRMVEGRYPNYESVIPKNYLQHAIFNRQDAISALRRVGVFASKMTSLVKLRLTDGKLEISSQDLDFSTSATESITAEYDGQDFVIGVHLGFMTEELGVIKSEMVRMEYADATRALILLPVQDEETDEEFIQLLMPMMLQQ